MKSKPEIATCELMEINNAKYKLAQAKLEYKKCLARFKQLDNQYNSFYSGITLLGFSIENFIPIVGILRYFDYKTLEILRENHLQYLADHQEHIQNAKKNLIALCGDYKDSDEDLSTDEKNNSTKECSYCLKYKT